MDVKETVRQQFDPVAAEYAVSAIHASGPDLSAMVGAIGLRGDEHVLDVAISKRSTTRMAHSIW
jgi:hypothetical protein